MDRVNNGLERALCTQPLTHDVAIGNQVDAIAGCPPMDRVSNITGQYPTPVHDEPLKTERGIDRGYGQSSRVSHPTSLKAALRGVDDTRLESAVDVRGR
jgi:hypothetical protein